MAAAGEEAADASSPHLRHAPLLLFDHDGKEETDDDGRHHQAASDGTFFFFYSIPSKQGLHRRVDEMKDHRYWTTPQGWLVMAARSSPATFLWDPFTGARISLPPDCEGFLRAGGGHIRCLLSCKPAQHEFGRRRHLVVLAVDLLQTVLWYCPLGGGDERWMKHEYDLATVGAATLSELPYCIRTLTSVGDKFFMELFQKQVVTLEFSPEPLFTVIPVRRAHSTSVPPCNGGSTTKFVESHGYLFCIRFSSSGYQYNNRSSIVRVQVSRLDFSARAWVEVDSLDGRAFLVHPQFGASLDDPQQVGLTGDCIYYCMSGDKAVQVYDMKRGTTSMRNPGTCIEDRSSAMLLMPTIPMC
ncbi:hypothetical protein BS78_02G173500 [Paspalum vaginatum]|nr:hypothetical protein BS78_02G173500 [Paspalum vaginatum]